MVCGAATGALFKSTLGLVPTAFGAVLGAGLAGAIHLLTEEGNKRGLIGF
jgi:import inner membrane translocase subunit TIM23